MSVALRISSWTGEDIPPAPTGFWGLKFTAEQEDSGVNLGTGAHISLQTSIDDGETWSPYTLGTTIQLDNIGDSVCFAAADGVTNSSIYPSKFALIGKVAASGDISSLLKNDQATASSIALSGDCYRQVFENNSALTSAPELPATNLAQQCYYRMFYGCKSMVKGPSALPAMTLAAGCYKHMFYYCEALETAPDLPATTLADSACDAMFAYCYALTTAPLLAATTLAKNGYGYLFYKCTGLTSITVHFTDWNPDGVSPRPTDMWLSGVASTGTFYCPAALGDNSTIARGSNNCPYNWTVVNI